MCEERQRVFNLGTPGRVIELDGHVGYRDSGYAIRTPAGVDSDGGIMIHYTNAWAGLRAGSGDLLIMSGSPIHPDILILIQELADRKRRNEMF